MDFNVIFCFAPGFIAPLVFLVDQFLIVPRCDLFANQPLCIYTSVFPMFGRRCFLYMLQFFVSLFALASLYVCSLSWIIIIKSSCTWVLMSAWFLA